MRPYYSEAGIEIYLGDCAEIAPQLGRFDLLATDPPFGIGQARQANRVSTTGYAKQRDYGDSDWDDAAPSDALLTDLRRSPC